MAVDYDTLDVEVINEIIDKKDPTSLTPDELDIYIEYYARARARDRAIVEMKEANEAALADYAEQMNRAAEMNLNAFNDMCDAMVRLNEERERLAGVGDGQ